MRKECVIVEDLLPLYVEDLLQEETEIWVKEHLSICDACKKKRDLTMEPVVKEVIESPVNYEKMIAKNNVKIALYQLIFIGFSFFLAMRAVILEEDFSFILAYTVLGFLTYLFYKKYKFVILIAFLPVFVWVLGTMLLEINDVIENSMGDGVIKVIIMMVVGAFFWAIIHLLFAIIGATIGLFTLKLFAKEDES